MSKAYVLLSGGLDSSTLFHRALKEFDNSVCAVSVNYGQRHTKELECAKAVVSRAKALHPGDDITHRIVDLSQIIGVGGLTDKYLEIPPVSYDDLEGVSPTYVPFRNGLLLSALTSIASADPEAEAVFYGAHAEDAQNWAYPDCTPEFIAGMSTAIFIGTYMKIRLHTPYMWYRKDQIVSEGAELGVHYDLTWSCYEGREKHCGVCPTCRARKEAFERAGIVDPTIYAE